MSNVGSGPRPLLLERCTTLSLGGRLFLVSPLDHHGYLSITDLSCCIFLSFSSLLLVLGQLDAGTVNGPEKDRIVSTLLDFLFLPFLP